jgi:hypothetical protein
MGPRRGGHRNKKQVPAQMVENCPVLAILLFFEVEKT